jgi:hypothetical protein
MEEQGQAQKQAPTVRTDFTTFHDGVVLKNSDKIRTNWEDYYQVRPTDSVVTPSQQRPRTLRDSRTARAAVEPQAPPQEKNVRPADYIQIRSRPADETAKARRKNESSDPWRQSWRQTLEASH